MTTYRAAWLRLRFEGRVLAALLVVLSAWGVIVLTASSPSPTPPSHAAAPASSPLAGVPSNDITLGSSTAPMTLTVFADLTDVRFRRFDANVLPALVRHYVRPGRLQIQLRTLSSTTDDRWAAQLAHAASLQGRLWDFVQVFESSYSGALDTPTVRSMLGRITGLNVGASLTAARHARVNAAVARAASLAPQPMPNQPVFLLDGGHAIQLPPVGTSEPGRFLAAVAGLWRQASTSAAT